MVKRFEHLRVFSDSSDRLYHKRWLHLNQIKCSMFYTLYHPSLYKILAQNTPAPDEYCCDFSGTVSQGKQLDRRALSVAIQILLSFRCPPHSKALRWSQSPQSSWAGQWKPFVILTVNNWRHLWLGQICSGHTRWRSKCQQERKG